MTQMDPDSDGAASQEHSGTLNRSIRKGTTFAESNSEMQAATSKTTPVQAMQKRRLHMENAFDRRMACPPCISKEPWWTSWSPSGGDEDMGKPIDEDVETHRAQGKQDAVKKAHDESEVMDDSLRPQVPLAPCQAALLPIL